MEKNRNSVRFSNVFRDIMVSVESIRHRTYIRDTTQHGDNESWHRFKRSLYSDSESIQRRLSRMEKTRLLRTLDGQLSTSVRKFNNMKQEIEKTREERWSESTFEWVKTERSGDFSRFKDTTIENDIEYIIFQDDTRININLLGDVVLVHNENEAYLSDFSLKNQLVSVSQPSQPFISKQPTAQQIAPVIQDNPIHGLLRKAKFNTEEILLPVNISIPTSAIYDVITENFEDGEREILNFILKNITPEMISDALFTALHDKYTK